MRHRPHVGVVTKMSTQVRSPTSYYWDSAEASSGRHHRLLVPCPASLPSLEEEGRASHHSLVVLVTTPHPRATQRHLMLCRLGSHKGSRNFVPGTRGRDRICVFCYLTVVCGTALDAAASRGPEV